MPLEPIPILPRSGLLPALSTVAATSPTTPRSSFQQRMKVSWQLPILTISRLNGSDLQHIFASTTRRHIPQPIPEALVGSQMRSQKEQPHFTEPARLALVS